MRPVLSPRLLKALANPKTRKELGSILANGKYGESITIDNKEYRVLRSFDIPPDEKKETEK